jgi:beta-glucan synthesis-associated protein KRE6
MLELINIAAKTGTGFYDEPYELIFSDEIKIENRTLYLGDDPYLESVDIWYGAANDLKKGKLVILMESVFNYGRQYRSGLFYGGGGVY